MPPLKKRKTLESDAAARLRSCIGTTGASDAAVCSIWNKAVTAPDEKVKPGTFKKHVQKALQPALNCFEKFALPGANGEDVEIYVANMEKMLHFVGSEMPSLAVLLGKALSQGAILQPVIYHDEAIAGNPLSAEKVMKSMLVYLSWKELQRSLFWEDAWLCVSLIQHKDTDKLTSGFNGVMTLLVKELFQPRWEIGFATNLKLSAVSFPFSFSKIKAPVLGYIHICLLFFSPPNCFISR